MDPFGRPCVDGQAFDGDVDLFTEVPILRPDRPSHRRILQRLPQEQPLQSFGFTTGSIGPFTTGPLSPSTTTPTPFTGQHR